MSLQVRLYLRTRLDDGSRPYLDPVYKNKKLEPLCALLDGQPKKFLNGCYYLRFRKNGRAHWEAVGSQAKGAILKKLRREQILAAQAAGLTVLGAPPPGGKRDREPPKEREVGLPTMATVNSYLGDISKYKRDRTYVAYRNALDDFLRCCSKPFLHQIDRRDILDFVDAMKKRGNAKRTVANKVKNVLIFLKQQGFAKVIHKSDIPKYTDKIVKAYQPEPLQVLFAAADQEDRILFHFFLGSGCRDNEVVHAMWEDIDFRLKTHDVREKREYPKYEVKDFEERTIPLPDALIEMLLDHRKRHPGKRLIFAGESGNPDHHLIRRLKCLAQKAGLNCGRCVSRNRETGRVRTCDQSPICKEWTLHRFRKTFATMHADAGVKIHTISRWLGHADLDTTMTYLEGSLATSTKTREQVNNTFHALHREAPLPN
jgi:integrase/recombinase XerD